MSIHSAIVVFFLAFNFSPSSNHSINVEVTGLRTSDGDVVISIYNRSDYFPKSEAKYKYKVARVKVANKQVKYSFKDLPQGAYAVAIYHDENASGEFDSNFVGYPLEGYGFSKNFKPRFSAPEFKDVSFDLQEDKLIAIKMLY